MSNTTDHLSLIVTSDAPSAIGSYSQGIVYGDLIFTAGQIPLDPESMTVVDGGIEEQAERVLANLAGVVTAAGSSLGQVIKTTCFLADLSDFPVFNAV